MAFENKYILRGKSQAWVYNGGCEYESEYHRGKVEYHHPISYRPDVGCFLCELHHSIILSRLKRYTGEMSIDKSLAEMKREIQELVARRVIKAGLSLAEIDKK